MTLEGLLNSVNLDQDILPDDAANRPSEKKLKSLSYITVHETDNYDPSSGADNHRRYLLNGGGANRHTWHFTVDDKEAWQHLRMDERGRHANSGNSVSLGVEMCVNKLDTFGDVKDRTARLVAYLLVLTGLENQHVKQHNHWSGKNCPRKTRTDELAGSWEDFLESVASYVSGVTERETIRTFEENFDVRVTPGSDGLAEDEEPDLDDTHQDITQGLGV